MSDKDATSQTTKPATMSTDHFRFTEFVTRGGAHEHRYINGPLIRWVPANSCTLEEFKKRCEDSNCIPIAPAPEPSDRLHEKLALANERCGMLAKERDEAKSECAAFLDWLKNQQSWEAFWADGFLGEKPVSQAKQNLQAIRKYLEATGHGLKFLAERDALQKQLDDAKEKCHAALRALDSNAYCSAAILVEQAIAALTPDSAGTKEECPPELCIDCWGIGQRTPVGRTPPRCDPCNELFNE